MLMAGGDRHYIGQVRGHACSAGGVVAPGSHSAVASQRDTMRAPRGNRNYVREPIRNIRRNRNAIHLRKVAPRHQGPVTFERRQKVPRGAIATRC